MGLPLPPLHHAYRLTTPLPNQTSSCSPSTTPRQHKRPGLGGLATPMSAAAPEPVPEVAYATLEEVTQGWTRRVGQGACAHVFAGVSDGVKVQPPPSLLPLFPLRAA